MSLFGSLLGDVEDDPFFGSHMRHMRQMNSMMNSMFSDPFGMLGGQMSLMPRHSMGMGMMPFMPQMPNMNSPFSNLEAHMSGPGSSFSSSTVVMTSNGPNGKPQVYSTSSSTKIGPDGIKETRKTLQDSRTGTKKMSIGHHIGARAHLVEREQNVYSGDAEERQEFINLDEDEAEEFDREFQQKAGALGSRAAPRPRLALPPPPAHLPPAAPAALPAAAPPAPAHLPAALPHVRLAIEPAPQNGERRAPRPAPRRPLRPSALSTSASVREVYGGSHPQRHRHRSHKHRPADN